jgi:hypothetical protein
MSRTYNAILTGDRVEWEKDAPAPTTDPLRVQITVLDEPTPRTDEERRQRLAEALERLTETSLSKIPDPVEWQRQQRKDRPLPGREDDEPNT